MCELIIVSSFRNLFAYTVLILFHYFQFSVKSHCSMLQMTNFLIYFVEMNVLPVDELCPLTWIIFLICIDVCYNNSYNSICCNTSRRFQFKGSHSLIGPQHTHTLPYCSQYLSGNS